MKTTVEWPTGLTRERLMELADWQRDHIGEQGNETAGALYALAERAPSGKPATEVKWMWIGEQGTEWRSNDPGNGAVRVELPILPKKPRTVTMHFYDTENGIQAHEAFRVIGYVKTPPFKLFTREIELEA